MYVCIKDIYIISRKYFEKNNSIGNDYWLPL